MRKVPKVTFFIVALLIFGMAWIALVGVDFSYGDISSFSIKGAPDIRTGIDIRGGIEATLVPDTGTTPTREQVDAAKEIIELRLDSQNITDYDVYTDYAAGSILVRYPWKSDETDYNPEEAIEELAASALLTFQDDDGKILMYGERVDKATAGYDNEDGKYVVYLDLDSKGTKEFAEITKEYKGENISIYMDDQCVSTATVQDVIDTGVAVISGSFTREEAVSLANTINAGSLPFALTASGNSSISPTLGEGALTVTVYAAIVSFILVCLFIFIYYRVPGFVACIALVGQVAGAILAVSIPQFTLTLPGIAGIILSIGMGVDANIITAERIREEVRAGRTISGAIGAGYDNSWSAILDGNITVLIVAVILYFLGSGSVKSFGYTLGVGVVLNFVMGVWASKLMQKGLSGFKVFDRPWLYGGARSEKN